jgi:hypothetical protein
MERGSRVSSAIRALPMPLREYHRVQQAKRGELLPRGQGVSSPPVELCSGRLDARWTLGVYIAPEWEGRLGIEAGFLSRRFMAHGALFCRRIIQLHRSAWTHPPPS